MFFIISEGILEIITALGIIGVLFCCVIIAAIPTLLATVIVPHIQIVLIIGIPLVLFLCVCFAKLHFGKHYSALAVDTLSLFLVAQSFFVFILFGVFPDITRADIFTIVLGLVAFFLNFGLTACIALWCVSSLLDNIDGCSVFSRSIRYILSLSISIIHLWLWMWILKITNTTADSIMAAYQVGPNHIIAIIARLIESVPNFFGIGS